MACLRPSLPYSLLLWSGYSGQVSQRTIGLFQTLVVATLDLVPNFQAWTGFVEFSFSISQNLLEDSSCSLGTNHNAKVFKILQCFLQFLRKNFKVVFAECLALDLFAWALISRIQFWILGGSGGFSTNGRMASF